MKGISESQVTVLMDDINMAAFYSQYYHPPPPPPLAVVPPPPGAAAPPGAQYGGAYQQAMFSPYPPPFSPDEVRTLFVAGLPQDVKPREIYNLFREFPGYESSHLRNPSDSSQVFFFLFSFLAFNNLLLLLYVFMYCRY